MKLEINGEREEEVTQEGRISGGREERERTFLVLSLLITKQTSFVAASHLHTYDRETCQKKLGFYAHPHTLALPYAGIMIRGVH